MEQMRDKKKTAVVVHNTKNILRSTNSSTAVVPQIFHQTTQNKRHDQAKQNRHNTESTVGSHRILHPLDPTDLQTSITVLVELSETV